VLRHIKADATSGLATLVIYVFQTVAIFAICSEYLTHVSKDAFKFEGGSPPADWLGYAYLAWANLVTFGGAYPPQSTLARLLIACSGMTFLLLFSVLLAFVVAKISED